MRSVDGCFIKMQRANEKWERTKRYLFRSLLIHPDSRVLSPVPEESRSDSSENRPYSPLPDLIVEREPNRHDESPEFYRGLEVRMRRYYRKLFLEDTDPDSVEYEDLNENGSMKSPFLKDGNSCKDNETNRSKSDEHKTDTESRDTESDDALLKGIHEVSKDRETSFKHVTCAVLDMGEDRRISNKEIHGTVETDSDSTQDNHRISITVAQIHEEKKRPEPMTRAFEDGSPILVPRLRKLSKRIFGALSSDISEFINYTDKKDIIEGCRVQSMQDEGVSNKSTEKEPSHTQAKEQQHIDTNIEEQSLDLEVQNLNRISEAATSSTPNVIQANKVEDNTSSSDVDEEEIVGDDQSTTTNNSIETEGGEAYRNENSIGPNEYDYTQQCRKDTSSSEEDSFLENDDDSFEMALRRGIFERIDRRKTFAQSSDELTRSSVSDSENRESEVMRGAIQTGSLKTEAMRRKSTISQESPIVRAFTVPTTEEFEEETSFHDEGQAILSAESKDTQGYRGSLQESPEFVPCQLDENNVDLSERTENQSEALLKINESNIKSKDATITVSANDLLVTSRAEFWSVSPVDVNVANLSQAIQTSVALSRPADPNKNKREARAEVDLAAPEKKKRKYRNVEVQTSAREESYQGWENLKRDFFVGTPLVYNLCKCSHHTCE